MGKNDLKLTEKMLDTDGVPLPCIEVGDEFDPWWGYDVVTLCREDIYNLFKGKVLLTNNGEYAILIALKQEMDEVEE